MSRCYLDIETATQVQRMADVCVADLGPDAGTDVVEQWTADHAADRALDPFGGRVTCWAVATDDTDWVRVDRGDGEGDLLQRLLACLRHVSATQIVAHNGSRFDAPFIRARALHHGLDDLAKAMWQSKPWETRVVDTALPEWAPRPMHADKGWMHSLDALAELLGIQRDATLAGSEMPAAWYDGRHDLVAAHCLDDVRTLRSVYHRLAAGRVG